MRSNRVRLGFKETRVEIVSLLRTHDFQDQDADFVGSSIVCRYACWGFWKGLVEFLAEFLKPIYPHEACLSLTIGVQRT